MNIQSNGRYHEVHARSLADPEGFWAEAAREIDWIEPAKKIFDPSMGAYGRWFAGAVVNTCYNALDRHVANGRADQVALIHDSPLTNTISKFTYAEMLKEVQTLAAVMAGFGVGSTMVGFTVCVGVSTTLAVSLPRFGPRSSMLRTIFLSAEDLSSSLRRASVRMPVSFARLTFSTSSLVKANVTT